MLGLLRKSSMGNTMRLLLAACLALLAGCSTTGTTVEDVWRDSARPDARLGKTLVVALTTHANVSIELEDEWVRQLRGLGLEAYAINALLPGERPLSEQRVVELVKAEAFDTVLVSHVVGSKQVSRDVAASQVAVVETKLYDSKTEKAFWSARSDTYLIVGPDGTVREPRSEQIQGFVETIIQAMSESKVL